MGVLRKVNMMKNDILITILLIIISIPGIIITLAKLKLALLFLQ